MLKDTLMNDRVMNDRVLGNKRERAERVLGRVTLSLLNLYIISQSTQDI